MKTRKIYHVSKTGNDQGKGTRDNPFLTISEAALHAQPGDTVLVQEGIYREEVNPPRGGSSDTLPITYQAQEGDLVEIRGSEIVTNWQKYSDNIWVTKVDNRFFGDYNPFGIEVIGDWFNPTPPDTTKIKDGDMEEDSGKQSKSKKRTHHLSAVYIDDNWLFEAASIEDLSNSKFGPNQMVMAYWSKVEETATTIYANFSQLNPNEHQTEINVRETVFYPKTTGINFIHVKGFKLRMASPPWAPPTTEQKGLIGTNWSKGWLIEGNEISHSINSGVTLGKYGDEYGNNGSTSSAYEDTISRAAGCNWNKEHVGSHRVYNNTISHCEQGGIIGSLGAIFSHIKGNYIHHIHHQRRFTGAEMAGIKIHAPIDLKIEGNYIHHAFIGVWLDWMAQGSQVSRNLFHDNDCHDLYVEVNHGPYIVDNNIFLSNNCRHLSQGGAWIHNLHIGNFGNWDDDRKTPYFKPHSTELIDYKGFDVGDDRFHNNIFVGKGKDSSLTLIENPGSHTFYYSAGLRCYDYRPQRPKASGNLYLNRAEPSKNESDTLELKGNPEIYFTKNNAPEGVEVYLHHKCRSVSENREIKVQQVSTDQLSKAEVPKQEFTNPEGEHFNFNKDYFQLLQKENSSVPGPIVTLFESDDPIKVWPNGK